MTAKIKTISETVCAADSAPSSTGTAGQKLKQQCVSKALRSMDDAADNRSPIKPEINYDMTVSPPSPIMSRSNPLKGTGYLANRAKDIAGFRPKTGMVRRPDAVIARNTSLPPTQDNLRGVVEIKFPGDPRNADQIADYRVIAGDSTVLELNPAECECPKSERQTIEKPGLFEVLLLLTLLAALLADDATGAGAADDVLIPGILARLAMAF